MHKEFLEMNRRDDERINVHFVPGIMINGYEKSKVFCNNSRVSANVRSLSINGVNVYSGNKAFGLSLEPGNYDVSVTVDVSLELERTLDYRSARASDKDKKSFVKTYTRTSKMYIGNTVDCSIFFAVIIYVHWLPGWDNLMEYEVSSIDETCELTLMYDEDVSYYCPGWENHMVVYDYDAAAEEYFKELEERKKIRDKIKEEKSKYDEYGKRVYDFQKREIEQKRIENKKWWDEVCRRQEENKRKEQERLDNLKNGTLVEDLDICRGKYTGEARNGKPHGKGVYKGVDFTIEGMFVDGEVGEEYTCILKNGDSYKGGFKNFKFEGKGIYYYGDGNGRYEGVFVNGKKHGKGRMYSYNGMYLEQEYKDDVLVTSKDPDVCGISSHTIRYITIKGGKYLGEHENNVPKGAGAIFYDNGDIYFGEMLNGEKYGIGIQKYSNGDIYVGEWYFGIRKGYGSIIKGNLMEYGWWSEDTLKAVYYRDANYTHNLDFDSNCFKNVCVKVRNDGRYVGEIDDDWRCGVGIYYFKDGSKFVGKWDSDDMNGPGCFKDTSYDSFFCEYKDNSLNGVRLGISQDNKKFELYKDNKVISKITSI